MPEPSQRGSVPPLQSAVSLDAMRGDDDRDTKLLREMAERAIEYVRSFDWCVELHETSFGDGVGGVVALFLFYVSIREVEDPEWTWVVVGDFPSAYMEFEAALNPHAALLRYIEGVEEWWASTPEERSTGDLIPIDVPDGPEFIEMLHGRMGTLRSLVLPNIREN